MRPAPSRVPAATFVRCDGHGQAWGTRPPERRRIAPTTTVMNAAAIQSASAPRVLTAVRAFRPKIVYPYHCRGSDLEKFKKLVGAEPGVEVRLRDWYAP